MKRLGRKSVCDGVIFSRSRQQNRGKEEKKKVKAGSQPSASEAKKQERTHQGSEGEEEKPNSGLGRHLG